MLCHNFLIVKGYVSWFHGTRVRIALLMRLCHNCTYRYRVRTYGTRVPHQKIVTKHYQYQVRTYVQYGTRTVTYRRRAQGGDVVRIQAYMLADFVVAIPAVDLAIEAVV